MTEQSHLAWFSLSCIFKSCFCFSPPTCLMTPLFDWVTPDPTHWPLCYWNYLPPTTAPLNYYLHYPPLWKAGCQLGSLDTQSHLKLLTSCHHPFPWESMQEEGEAHVHMNIRINFVAYFDLYILYILPSPTCVVHHLDFPNMCSTSCLSQPV